MQTIFDYFLTQQWIYERKLADVIWRTMSPSDQKEFCFDTSQINWKVSLYGYSYGIRRFYLREDCQAPDSGYLQLLAKNQIELFHDERVAFKRNKNLINKDTRKYFPAVLNAQRFDDFIFNRVKLRGLASN